MCGLSSCTHSMTLTSQVVKHSCDLLCTLKSPSNNHQGLTLDMKLDGQLHLCYTVGSCT